MKCLKSAVGHALVGVIAVAAELVSAGAPAGPIDGSWAGDRLQLVIDANGGKVEMDCASGTFTGPFALSGAGTFLASGTFAVYRAGPQRADESVAPAKAQYSGDVKEGVMRLSILPDGASTPQVFNLRKGASVKLIRCL